MLALRPPTFGNWSWMFDAVAELTQPSTLDPPPTELAIPELAYLPPRTTKKRNTLTSRLSRLPTPNTNETTPAVSPTLFSPTASSIERVVPQYAADSRHVYE